MNFYSWLQQGLHIDLPMASNEDLFHQYRDRLNRLTPKGQEAASLVYFLNRTSYNGLWRVTKKSGEFNTPWVRTRRSPTNTISLGSVGAAGLVFHATDFQAVRLSY